MEIYFYSFAKRNNSTKQPSAEVPHTSIHANLKAGCDVTKPVLLIRGFEPIGYNYSYIPSFRRFYFISEVKYIENMYEISLIEDVLASFKSEIAATNALVMYASLVSTKDIIDDRIPVEGSILVQSNSKAPEHFSIPSELRFCTTVIGVTGKGSFGSFILPYGIINQILDGVDGYVETLEDAWDMLKQFFYGGTAANCFKSAIAIPLIFSNPDVDDDNLVPLVLGNYPCKDRSGDNIEVYEVRHPAIVFNDSITIPWVYSDWRRNSAYCDVSLYIPMFGLFSINASEAKRDLQLDLRFALNVTSGDFSVEIKGHTSGIVFGISSTNISIATAYGATGIDTTKATNAVVSGLTATAATAAAIASGGTTAAIAAAGAGFTKAVSSTIGAFGGVSTGSGGLGGGSSYILDNFIRIFVKQKVFTDTQENLNPIIGKPYMHTSFIRDFSGYVQTDGFKLESSSAYSGEKDKIAQLMDGGIYFE